MAFQSMDALQCFTFMSENVPSWITRVSDLAVHTAKKHAEFSEEYKKLTHVRPRRRKNSSVHSIRPTSELKAAGVLASSQKDNNQGSLDANRSDQPAGSRQRKDKDNDDAASRKSADGPQFVSSRYNVVIHYDGHTQKELEQVVRDIGTARNSIRKGKMAQMMRKPNLGVDMFASRLASKDTSKPVLPSINGVPPFKTTRSMQKESPFDFADKQLELAQSLCETAAHQFLRYGNCSTELENVKEKFNEILEAAKKEVARLKAEKELEQLQQQQQQEEQEQEQEQEQKEKEKEKQTEAEEPLTKPIEAETDKPVGVVEDGKPLEPGAAAIEVDDSASESSVSIDITAFRASRFRA
ncbi:hypothetical protein VTN77DRAFT_2431 [Rasamsonia byssochlamydoides]|uniref:uncharacterized protein n=1 Tax=Rasamsonia byssochlamydoides TaxID=89139 RepID=UPI0037446EE9